MSCKSLQSTFGLLLLLGYTLYGIYFETKLPLLIKGAVFACLLGSMIFSATMLRNPKAKHQYEK